MKASEVHNLEDPQLVEFADRARQEVFNLRFQHATGQLENTARLKQAKKDLARLEQQIARLDRQLALLHEQMLTAADDYQRLTELQREMESITASKDELELAWLEAAAVAG